MEITKEMREGKEIYAQRKNYENAELAVKTCEFGHKERLEQKSGNVRALF